MSELKNRLESKEISYREDIAKEVSEATGIDYDLCLDIQKGIFEFVVEETQEENNYSINLPWLGVLYLNKVLGNYTRASLHTEAKKSEKVDVKLKFWERRLFTMKAYQKDNNLCYQACKHFTLPFASKFKGMLPEEYRARTLLGSAKSIEIYAAVEEVQNLGYYKELEKIKGKKY